MNTLTTIAVWLAGSAVVQVVGFYCYSTFQNSRILKSLSYEGSQNESSKDFNKPGGKIHFSQARQGGKANVVHHSNSAAANIYSKSKNEALLLKQITH